MAIIVECPRDAMQGISQWIPTALKIRYLNLLLQVGFPVIDFGSFVSPKAIPQLADTKEVLASLQLNPATKLLAIVANTRGAEEALTYSEIDFIGFPFSISETFQLRNTNQTIEKAKEVLLQIQERCVKASRQLVVYLSMGFGNPYGDLWNLDLVEEWATKIKEWGIRYLSIADTVGTANPNDVNQIFQRLKQNLPELEIGAHFHSNPNTWREKVEAAWLGGCRRFDGAIKGLGGCPFAKEELVGNIATENLLLFLTQQGHPLPINQEALQEAIAFSANVFPTH
ncbi:MAG: hydroxymethylglutaryl-CoA lyase [Bacteroidia bacterium]|nr:hydroxymethylglutaryl-CoA lyase [Bacteroidia bacterium]